MESYLKYPGNKRWIKKWLDSNNITKKILDNNIKVVAPFCGALGDIFAICPKVAVLNDSYLPLINLHACVRDGLVLSLDLKTDAESYYKYRDFFNKIISDPYFIKDSYLRNQAAQLLYYLNKVGYHGMIRSSKNGYNVPFEKSNIKKAKSKEDLKLNFDFTEHSLKMKYWKFFYGDFEKIKLNGNEILILDPPYDTLTKTSIYSNNFDWDDQLRLITWAMRQNTPFILFNSSTERIIELYKSFANLNLIFYQRTRTISNQKNKKVASEVIITNFVY